MQGAIAMGGDCIVRIEKLENGYEVEICDPDIQESNAKPKSTWEDPWKGYAFTTADEVKTFIGVHLDQLKPPPGPDEEYAKAFESATSDKD
jgi:hypothetical protein